MDALLRQYYGTNRVTFTFNSNVTGTSHTYTSTEALVDEVTLARIHGGMHFRYSTVAGSALGQQVANWTLQHGFGPRN